MNHPFDALRAACDGLTFPSETDAPIEPFFLPNQSAGPITPELLRELAHLPAGMRVEASSLEKELAPLAAEEDWMNEDESTQARRFRLLMQVLEEGLRDVQVFRLGDGPRFNLYVVGRCEGGLAGIKTLVVET